MNQQAAFSAACGKELTAGGMLYEQVIRSGYSASPGWIQFI